MKRFAALCLLAAAASAQGVVHVDDAGRSVEFPAPPSRVVTLAPNLTEFVYAVGAGATLVGTMDTSNYPEAATRVPRIGDYQRLDVERILALKPELVLVWHHGNQGRELGQLEAAGLRLFYLEPKRIDDVPRTLVRVGALLGHADAGEAQAARLRAELAELRQKHAGAAPVSVFFQVWSQPLMTLNGEHLTSDVLALCGGRNVFASLPALAPQVSLESVVAADPQAIFTATDESSWRRDPDRRAFAIWQPFPRLTAVRRGWMYGIPGDLITRQGPRIVEGVRAACAALDEVRRERAAR
ncbi:MAG TPA: cobalamin-binding protein [Albitalea sp.]|uniref:cobalamin-binding protein n=1 Tax=Piscinibacter sp. TaxID=1903157 RepID=UPI002ECFEC4D